jgi:serine/threonine protein phosphatase PrpC
VNEDEHSPLDGNAGLFVVADGVGSGALASCASRELVAHVHAVLGRGRVGAAAVRTAILGADREIARSIARRTSTPGAATVALCVAINARRSQWLVAWVGDCRAYRLRASREDGTELLTVDDTYRQLNERSPSGAGPDDPARARCWFCAATASIGTQQQAISRVFFAPLRHSASAVRGSSNSLGSEGAATTPRCSSCSRRPASVRGSRADSRWP